MDQQSSNLNQRRKFLTQLLTGSMATLALPAFANDLSFASAESLSSPEDPSDERYWEMIKKQFMVPSNLIMFNAANLCPSPYYINDIVDTAMKGLEKDVSFQYRSQFAAKRAKSLEKMSQFLGVSKEEVGIVRNASEANTIIVQGLDLKSGDEIIIWDQNHASNGMAWEQQARRFGLVIKKISIPVQPKSVDELITPFAKASQQKQESLLSRTYPMSVE
ncbi:MAG: aminotransferase class V-fold PLP-dependent enzyme [Cyclobacteriaceae bacterium]|nr:aminotransferase class V-fold PLP-dependent enzyme [Cyclobacteriaceae bacterium]